jgi:ankyrin repeat protein/Zn-dependent protease with chaperone function
MNFLFSQNLQELHFFESLLAVGIFGVAIWLLILLANPLLQRLSSRARYACLLSAQLLLGLSLPLALLLIPTPPDSSPHEDADYSPPPALQVHAAAKVSSVSHLQPAAHVAANPGAVNAITKAAAKVPKKYLAVPQTLVQSMLSRMEGSSLGRYSPLVCWGYSATVVLLLLRLLIAVHQGELLRARSEPIDEPFLLTSISRQARRMGLSYVPAFAACDVAGPCVIGFLRPMLLLPLALLAELSPEQVQMILAHEIAHIRRHDPFFSLIQRLIEAFLFFHPLVWYLSRRIHLERECCCDDLVLNGGPTAENYAEVLANVARLVLQRISTQRFNSPAAQLAATGRPSQLRLRVRRILKQNDLVAAPLRNEPLRLDRRSSILVVALSVLSCGLVVASTLASPSRPAPLPSSVASFKGMNGLHEAAAAGTREQLAAQLHLFPVDKPTLQGWSALEIAAAVGREDIINDLLAAGANPNFADRQGRTPLFASLGLGPTAAMDLVPSERLNVIRLLVRHGANIGFRDHSGMTPLDAAVVRGFSGAAAFLIQRGADVNVRDLHGRTAVIFACEGAMPDTLELLVKAGADLQIKDDAGRDAIDAAVLRPEARGPYLARIARCASILIRTGMHPRLCAAAALGLQDEVKTILRHRSPELLPDDVTEINFSPLCWAISNGDAAMVKLLLDSGANPNKNDALSSAIFHVPMHGDNILRILLNAKALTNVQDSGGSTPLRNAVAQMDVKTICLLRSYGADPSLIDSAGRIPAEYIPDDTDPNLRQNLLTALSKTSTDTKATTRN